MDENPILSKRWQWLIIAITFLFAFTPFGFAVPPLPNQSSGEGKSETLFDGFLAAQRNDAELNHLFVLSPDHVWAVGERGTILFSEDGGRNWRFQESGTTCSLKGVYFSDSQKGWAVGFHVSPYSQRPHGIILQTIDGGKRWQIMPQPFLPPLSGIQSNAQGNLIAWGNWSSQLSSSVFESIDGGRQWAPLPHLSSTFQHVVPQATSNIGLDDQGQLWRWELQGAIGLWQRKDIAGTWKAFAFERDQLIAVTEDGSCFQGAPNRPPQAVVLSNNTSPLTSTVTVAARGSRRWLAGHPGNVILRSEDAGVSWQAIPTNFSLPIKQLCFLDENRGWAIGELGNILATRDGGLTWWLQRSSARRVGVMAFVDHPDQVPWPVLGLSSCEYKRVTSIVYLASSSPTNRFHENYLADRFQAAAAAIGASDLTILKKVATDSSNSESQQETARLVQSMIDAYRPEIIVIGTNETNDSSDLKSAVLQAVAKTSTSITAPNSYNSATPTITQVRKVFVTGTARLKSFEISGSQILRHSGKLLTDVCNRASSLISEQTGDNNDSTLVLIYSDNPTESSSHSLIAGTTLSDEAMRSVDLGHQGNLQVVLGAAARKKSLERLLEIDERRDPREEYWNEQFRSVCDTLPKEEIDHALIWLADQLRRQAKWQKWQVVAETIIRRSPAGGPAEKMWRQLLCIAASDELSTWRKRQQQNRNQAASSLVVTASAQSRDTPPSSPFESSTNARSSQPVNALDVSITDQYAVDPKSLNSSSGNTTTNKVATSDELPTAPLMLWLLDQLPQRNAVLLSDPNLLLQLSSWYARYPDSSQLRVDTLNGLINMSRQPYLGSYQRAATLELALGGSLPNNRVAPTPTGAPSHELPFGRNYSFQIEPTASRPLLDGLGDEASWLNAYKVLLADPVDRSKSLATEAKFTYDSEWLYIHLVCQRPEASVSPDRIEKRGYDSDLSGQDRVRILIDTDRDRETVYELEVDHRGLTRDSCWGISSWNPKWFVAQRSDTQHWMVELAIPLAELSDRESIDDCRWCIALERTIPRTSIQRWPMVSEQSSAPFDFGILRFTAANSYQPPAGR